MSGADIRSVNANIGSVIGNTYTKKTEKESNSPKQPILSFSGKKEQEFDGMGKIPNTNFSYSQVAKALLNSTGWGIASMNKTNNFMPTEIC